MQLDTRDAFPPSGQTVLEVSIYKKRPPPLISSSGPVRDVGVFPSSIIQSKSSAAVFCHCAEERKQSSPQVVDHNSSLSNVSNAVGGSDSQLVIKLIGQPLTENTSGAHSFRITIS